jgi:hypothetical protein
MMAWVREGYCCKCGECCVGDPFTDDNRPRAAVVPGYCPLFEWRGDKEGFCIGHIGAVPAGKENPYYLSGCIAWPSDPLHIADKPSCTYSFRWED